MPDDDLTKHFTTQKSADHTRRQAWRKYPVGDMFAIYQLYAGGITKTADIQKLTGSDYKAKQIESMVRGVQTLLQGPFILEGDIRCNTCGAKVRIIPCRVCQPQCSLTPGSYRTT